MRLALALKTRGRMAVAINADSAQVYADLAVSPVCVSCHNADPRSSKRDYALHDVLGGVAISIPMPE